MAPSPLLYTASPIVPDQSADDEVSTKLTVEVADRTLGLIEEVLESSKANANKVVTKKTRTRDTIKEMIKSKSFGFFALVAFLCVLIIGIVDLLTEITDVAHCAQGIRDLRDACLEPTAPVAVPPELSPLDDSSTIPDAATTSSTTAPAPDADTDDASNDGFSADYTAAAPDAEELGSIGGLQRRLVQLFDYEDEDEEPPSRDHCCGVSTPYETLAGCNATASLADDNVNKRIGLLELGTPRPLFTRDRVVVSEYFREYAVYCRMERLKRSSSRGSPETDANWLGAQKWRWLLFVAIYFPLGPISFAIAGVFSYIVTSFHIGGRNAAFLAFGLHLRVAWVIRNALWLGAWFILMWQPYQWARVAARNNVLAERDGTNDIWDDTFKDAYDFGWHLLLSYLLLAVFALVRSGITRVLSLRFHHTNHFDQMQKALVQESVVQALSKPNSLPETNVVNSGGRSVVLRGFDNAHWAALKWVSGIIDGAADELKELEGMDDEKLASIQNRAVQVQMRLAETLSTEWLKNCMSVSPRATAGQDLQFLPSGVSPLTGSHHQDNRIPQPQALDSLDEGTVSNQGLPVGMAGKLSGAAAGSGVRRRSTENQENESGGNGRFPQYGQQLDSARDAGVSLGTNQSAFNHNTSSIEFQHPVLAQDFIQSATSQITRTEQSPVPDGARAAGNLWSPVPSAKAQARWAGLRLRLKKQPTNTSRRASSSFYSTLQQVMAKKKKEELPDEAADAAAHLAQVQADQVTPPDTEAKRSLLFGRQDKEKDQQGRKAQKLASQLRRASETESSNINTTVQTLQNYLLNNSNIQVFSLIHSDGSIDDGTITDSVSARKLGYYIFWNLRHEHSGLAVDESEVKEAASRAGIRHTDTAWELFDRNCDQSATLEEVVGSVETVFDNRDNLLRTLHDNETVVSQVEIAIGLLFFIIWLFITAAIFDGAAVQRTWTALSAGLLSFSFIFGNSIREVFENAVFLFFTHPFDVGDAVVFEGDRFKVMSITLQYVKLIRLDGAAVNVPCSEMRSARIHNVSRSNNLWGNIKIIVDSDTSTSALETVGSAVQATIKANPKWYGGSYRVWWMDSLPGAKVELGIFYDYSVNGLDLLTVGIARTEMYTSIFDALKAINVEYTLPPVKGNCASGPDEGSTLPQGGAARHFGAEGEAQRAQKRDDNADNARAAVAQQAMLLA